MESIDNGTSITFSAPETVVQTAVVRPGDTLILRVADRAPTEYVQRLGAALEERLPDVKVLVLGGVAEMAIYRPEADE